MPTKRKLPRNHWRALSVVARSIDASLDDIETRVLNDRTSDSGLHRVARTLNDTQKRQLEAVLFEFRKTLNNFVREFQLSSDHVTDIQILKAQYSHIWVLLEESRPKRLRGYGALPDSVRPSLEEAIDLLSEHLGRLRDIWSSDEH